MADIFDEISEDLRQDKIIQLWKKFSKLIISFVVIIIFSIFGYQGYISLEKNKLNTQASDFFNALENLENSNLEKSEELFLKNQSNSSAGYLMLSIFGLAETNLKKNNITKMIENYKNIYENSDFDNYYRNLARILSVIKDNKSSYEQLHNRLLPILNSPSKLQSLAAELEIILFIRFDMIKKAKLSLSKLLNRKDVSMEQRNRLSLICKLYD